MKNYLILSAFLLIPGCGRVIDWGKDLVPQGEKFKPNLTLAQNYIRSCAAYDQLTTAAVFDALWLSDEVRSAYVRLFVDRRGKGQEQYDALVRRQLEENNFVIAFYVLCPFEITLGDVDSLWIPFLRIDGKQYAPTEVKVVDMVTEYKAFFDTKFNRFKQAYSIKFDARDVQDSPLIQPSTKELSLVFRSLRKDCVMTWDVQALKKNVVQPAANKG